MGRVHPGGLVEADGARRVLLLDVQAHYATGDSETVEGIRALAVDKDHTPRWNPARIEDITPDMVAPFFVSPWAAQDHPLAGL